MPKRFFVILSGLIFTLRAYGVIVPERAFFTIWSRLISKLFAGFSPPSVRRYVWSELISKNFAGRKLRAVLTAVCFALIFSFSAGLFAQTGLTVSEIIIEGNRRITGDAVETLISQRAGQPYDESKITGDIRKIYSSGNFHDVVVEKEISGSKISLTYTLKENPVLADISIKGNKEVSDEDIEGILTLEKGRLVGEAKIRSQAAEIARLYAVKGYSGAKISSDIEPESDGKISVTYKIREGPKQTIASVEFSGSEKVKDKRVKKAIFSSPRRFYSLGQRGLFIEEEVRKDAERIKSVYLDEGYLDVRVSGPKLNHDREKNSYEVSFEIEEGEIYTVTEISLKGTEAPPEINEDEVLYRLKLQEGKPYGNGRLAGDISFLTSVYANEGYADVNVEPAVNKTVAEGGGQGVSVVFTIEKGEIFHIGRINISGNDKTVDKVIRRQIPIAEGDRYRSGDIALIKPLIGRLGFFDAAAIEVSTEPSAENENELDLNIKVAETSTAQFNLGAGVSSVEDFIFFGSIQEANAFGYGKAVDASANFGGVTDTYSIRYSDRNFLDTDWSLDLSTSRIERDYDDYDHNSTGFTVGIGKSVYRQVWAKIYYRWEKLRIENPSQAATDAGIVESSGVLSAVGADLNWDGRDNYIFPTSGYRAAISYEHSGPFGGDTDLSKFVFNTEAWVPVFKGSFVAVRVRYDRLFIREETNHAIDERLFLGGAATLRGFDYREITAEPGSALGGTERIYAKADLVIPIVKPLGLYGILFYDIGNVFDTDKGYPFSINPSDLRKDFGYGFWWRSPLGLIKVEVGYPIDRLPNEEKKQVNFSIGASF